MEENIPYRSNTSHDDTIATAHQSHIKASQKLFPYENQQVHDYLASSIEVLDYDETVDVDALHSWSAPNVVTSPLDPSDLDGKQSASNLGSSTLGGFDADGTYAPYRRTSNNFTTSPCVLQLRNRAEHHKPAASGSLPADSQSLSNNIEFEEEVEELGEKDLLDDCSYTEERQPPPGVESLIQEVL